MALDFTSSSRLSFLVGSNTSWTVCQWVYVDSLPAEGDDLGAVFHMVAGSVGDQPAAWSGGLAIDSDGHLNGYISDGGSNRLDGTGLLSTGRWYHVAHRVQAGATQKIYIAGVEDASKAIATPYTGWGANAWMTIGYNHFSTDANRYNSRLDGKTQDFAFYQAAIDPEQIAAMAEGFAAPLVRRANLYRYLPMVSDARDVWGKATVSTTSLSAATVSPRIILPRRRSIIGVPAAGGGSGGTASGALDAQSSTVDGVSTSGSTASGTPEAQASTVSGVAVGAWFASGTPEAQPSTVDGEAASRSTASGSPDAQASDVAGAATSSSAATGDPEAGASTVDGSASVSGGTATASGTPDAQASTVSGAAAGSSTAVGTPDAQAATVDGAATAFWDVTAAIQAAPSTVEGAGSSSSAASGDAPAGECTVVGVAFSMSTGQGVLVCLASTVTGSEAEIIQIVRALMGGLLVKVGRLMAR